MLLVPFLKRWSYTRTREQVQSSSEQCMLCANGALQAIANMTQLPEVLFV